MNLIIANVTDLRRHFSEYLNRTAYSGESFVIVRGGKAIAELKPLARSKKYPSFLQYYLPSQSLPNLRRKGLRPI